MNYTKMLLLTKTGAAALQDEKQVNVFCKEAQKYDYTQILIILPYADKLFDLPQSTQSVAFQKAIIVTDKKEAQNYTKLKKGSTTAGEVAKVIYQPDFTSKTVDQDIRTICEKGWCDAILGLEKSPEKDGLQKKKHCFTQVEARFARQHNITLLFAMNTMTDDKAMPFELNRINQITHIAQKIGVCSQAVKIVSNKDDVESPLVLQQFLDVLKRKTI